MEILDRRQQLKAIILPMAREAFRLHGIRAVKMDDLAASLKMSKRTLYETYQNKEALLIDVLRLTMEEHHAVMQEFKEHNNDVMDLIIEHFRIQTENYAETNPLFFKDLKFYPDLTDKFRDIEKCNEEKTMEVFARGIEEGYFRPEVNYEFIAKVGRQFSIIFRTQEDFSQYDMHEVFISFVCTLLRGICTEKGIAKLDSFLQNNEFH
jgi:AcrR family transcriptional regulator